VEERADGSVASRWTPETRGTVIHELVAHRVSAVWPAVAAARIPTLLFAATEPAATRELNELHVPRFAAALPQAEIRWIEDAGHDLFADAAPRIAAELVAWLDGVPGR
jgi:pimeloyl-ACP methyl ester carboxylesterase